MTWATVTTGPDRDAPEQRRQPVGYGQGWGGDWQLRWGKYLEGFFFFFAGEGISGGPEELG